METKKSMGVAMIFIIGIGIISTIISKNEVLMDLLVYFISLFMKNADYGKISGVVLLVSRTWYKFALLVAFIYTLIYAIKNFDVIVRHPADFFRNIGHSLHSAKEKMKHASKVRRFRQATKSRYPEVVYVRHEVRSNPHDKDMISIKKSRAWPEDVSIKNQLIKEAIEKIIRENGNYTVTEVMRFIESNFDLSIKEKHQIIDDIRSVTSSSFRLAKYKKK